MLDRDNDPSKQQTTTVIAGPMAIRYKNRIRAQHATCNMKKSGHQDAANKSNTIGGIQLGKE
jgi:hypothetical protein